MIGQKLGYPLHHRRAVAWDKSAAQQVPPSQVLFGVAAIERQGGCSAKSLLMTLESDSIWSSDSRVSLQKHGVCIVPSLLTVVLLLALFGKTEQSASGSFFC